MISITKLFWYMETCVRFPSICVFSAVMGSSCLSRLGEEEEEGKGEEGGKVNKKRKRKKKKRRKGWKREEGGRGRRAERGGKGGRGTKGVEGAGKGYVKGGEKRAQVRASGRYGGGHCVRRDR